MYLVWCAKKKPNSIAQITSSLMATLAKRPFLWGKELYKHDVLSPHCITENLESINKK